MALEWYVEQLQKQNNQDPDPSGQDPDFESLLKTAPEPAEDDLTLPTMEDFEEKEVEWLVNGYIPKGCITILAGTGGTGKSSVWASLLASISSGKSTILEGTAGIEREPAKVMCFSTEDAIEQVIKPKLRKNGAIMKNILTLSPEDKRFEKIHVESPYFQKLIRKYKPAICLIDPLQSFLDKRVKMSERNAMRQALGPLLALGMECGTTFIILMHTNKQSGVYGRQRIADSSDIWDIARSVLMLGETGEDDQRYITHEKSNYGRLSRTVVFEVVDSVPVFKKWTDKKDRDYVLDGVKTRRNNGVDPVQECCNAILSELSEHDEGMPVKDMDELMKSLGFSNRNIRDAKKNLKEAQQVEYKLSGYGKDWLMFRKRE